MPRYFDHVALVNPRSGDIPASSLLVLTPAAPVPAGSDVTQADGTPVEAADLKIRDTANHDLLIPLRAAGYSSLSVGVAFASSDGGTFNDTVRFYAIASDAAGGAITVLRFMAVATGVVAGNGILLTTGSGTVPAYGAAGFTGTAQSTYSYPELAALDYVILRLQAPVATTMGEAHLTIIRA